MHPCRLGIRTGNVQYLWFSFSDLLQFELSNFAECWNTHHIRSSKPNCVVAVPDQLFISPEEYGYINRGTRLSLAELDQLKQQIDIERDIYIWSRGRYSNNVLLCVHFATAKFNIPSNKLDWSKGSIFKN